MNLCTVDYHIIELLTMSAGQHDGTVVSTVASQQKGPEFNFILLMTFNFRFYRKQVSWLYESCFEVYCRSLPSQYKKL